MTFWNCGVVVGHMSLLHYNFIGRSKISFGQSRHYEFVNVFLVDDRPIGTFLLITIAPCSVCDLSYLLYVEQYAQDTKRTSYCFAGIVFDSVGKVENDIYEKGKPKFFENVAHLYNKYRERLRS